MPHNANNPDPDVDQPGLWEAAARSERAAPPTTAPLPRRAVRRAPPALPSGRPLKPMEHQELWDINDLANYLGVPKQTIYSWRTSGYGPQGFRVGKHLRWRSATVIAWTLGLEHDGERR